MLLDNETTRSTDDPKQPSEQQNEQLKQMHATIGAINPVAKLSSDLLNETNSCSEFSVIFKDEEIHFACGIQQYSMDSQSNMESSQSNDILLSNVTVTISHSSAHIAKSNIRSSSVSSGKLFSTVCLMSNVYATSKQ